MKPRLSKMLMILALGAVSLRLSAQQSIIVSQPAGAEAKSTADDNLNLLQNDSTSDNSERTIHAGDYDAPHQFFRDYSPTLPAPAPVYINRNASDAANKNKNWTLLTPAEILGVKTPEDILGIKDTKDQDLSLDQQFLQRLRNGGPGGATNGGASAINWRGDDRNNPFDNNRSSGWGNSFNNNNNQFNNNNNPALSSRQTDSFQQPNQISDISRIFNQSGADSASQQNPDSIWTSPFAKPSQTQTRTSQAQLDAMERFRALMQPSSSQTKIATQTRYSPSSSKSEPATFFQQSQTQHHPSGNSMDPLFNSAARPTGIQPLSGFDTPRPNPETTRPEWQAQLPPWMRKGPQPH